MGSECWDKAYLCIDLKSFYASVECVDRGLDPFRVNLVVADPERSRNTICLAITPAMKAAGVRNRCRVREIPDGIEYLTAMPRMRRYMDVSEQICGIYQRYVSPDDMHVYSIDECFIDVTPYLRLYDMDAQAFARRLMAAVFEETGITATAGIGPNLFLCKVALDIAAKHADNGIGVLDAERFMREIWFHRPITDIWGIGPGIASRLARYGAHDLAGVCALNPSLLAREFGSKNAEVLLDHAWGVEPCTIEQIHSYVPKAHSVSSSQVLMRDYAFREARTVLREMAYGSCMELVAKGLACKSVSLHVGYSESMGLPVPYAGGSRKLPRVTDSERLVTDAILSLYDERVDRHASIRQVGIALGGLVPERLTPRSLFDGLDDGREGRLAQAMVAVRERFGANALLRGTSLREEANARERNNQIGGHRA